MRNVFKERDRVELLRRIEELDPERQPIWGTMTVHQAICHLNDAFLAALGPRPVEPMGSWFHRTVMRFAAFTLPIPWPKGVPTHPQWDQTDGGTRPEDIRTDHERLVTLLGQFADTNGRGLDPHPIFRDLTRGEWGRWAWRHVDHHLRQFGV